MHKDISAFATKILARLKTVKYILPPRLYPFKCFSPPVPFHEGIPLPLLLESAAWECWIRGSERLDDCFQVRWSWLGHIWKLTWNKRNWQTDKCCTKKWDKHGCGKLQQRKEGRWLKCLGKCNPQWFPEVNQLEKFSHFFLVFETALTFVQTLWQV